MKSIAFACLAATVAILAWWAVAWLKVPPASRSMFTQESYFVEVAAKDDFGDMVTKRTQVNEYTPGLLDLAGPAAGVAGAAGIGLLLLARRRSRKPA